MLRLPQQEHVLLSLTIWEVVIFVLQTHLDLRPTYPYRNHRHSRAVGFSSHVHSIDQYYQLLSLYSEIKRHLCSDHKTLSWVRYLIHLTYITFLFFFAVSTYSINVNHTRQRKYSGDSCITTCGEKSYLTQRRLQTWTRQSKSTTTSYILMATPGIIPIVNKSRNILVKMSSFVRRHLYIEKVLSSKSVSYLNMFI